MSLPIQYQAELIEGNIYHIYNRTNNKELLFRSDENRRFFLEKFEYYLSPFVELFTWNLLPTHFHFLIRVKTAEDIRAWLAKQEELKKFEKGYLDDKISCSVFLEKTFHRFFVCYSMAFNKVYKRAGNLFHRPFKRVLVESIEHFRSEVIYIHLNPMKHFIMKDFAAWEWSSWSTILHGKRQLNLEIFDRFGGEEEFIKSHHYVAQYFLGSQLEDDTL